ncbi:10439_t:CDS:2, partial [Gigaspora rosea]
QESDTECSTSEKIPEVSNPMTKISAGAPLPKNSHRKKGAENISQMISDESQISSTVPLLTLAQLFDKATDAEYGAIYANQEEILCWCYYGKKFITQVNEVTKGNKIGEKKAKGIIYDKMLEDLSILRKKRSEETGLQLPEITRKYLQGKTQKAVKIYNLFGKVGVDKIKYITTYTANAISELTNDKLQEIIDNFLSCNDRDDFPTPETSERIINAPSALESTEVSELIAPIPIIHGSNSLGNSSFTPQIAPAE